MSRRLVEDYFIVEHLQLMLLHDASNRVVACTVQITVVKCRELMPNRQSCQSGNNCCHLRQSINLETHF